VALLLIDFLILDSLTAGFHCISYSKSSGGLIVMDLEGIDNGILLIYIYICCTIICLEALTKMKTNLLG
jgi:hypothetical protein